jgi:hypothetical protein
MSYAIEVDDLRKRTAAAAILVIAGVALLTFYYFYPQPKTARIMFAGTVLTVELATTPTEQQRGLSGRDSMPADHGMLFVFQQPAQWGFWMIEMKFPLDIIWFDANKHAIFIEQDLAPCTPDLCPVFTPPADALYVLEVNAGFVRTHSVMLGDSFTYI